MRREARGDEKCYLVVTDMVWYIGNQKHSTAARARTAPVGLGIKNQASSSQKRKKKKRVERRGSVNQEGGSGSGQAPFAGIVDA